jgi:hypothetical protein
MVAAIDAPVDLDQLVRHAAVGDYVAASMGMLALQQYLHRTGREATVMRNGWRGVFVMGLEVVAIGMGIAWAGGGLITFSGAVVNPTCRVAAPVLPDAPPSAVPVHGVCDSRSASSSADPAPFERVVVRLSDHERMPLLSRFSDAAAAASPKGERPLLVVQTYD